MAKRFYETVSVSPSADCFAVLLDTHELKSPAKQPLCLPSAALAELVAEEWQAQGEEIDTQAMLHMRLVSTARDRVSEVVEETAKAFAAYGMSDLLCYRAENPDKLVARQAAAWDPLLAWAQSRFDVSFEVTSGVLPVTQPAINEVRLMAAAGQDIFRLTGLAHVAALLGSALLALALDDGHINAEQAYELAFLDDLFQMDEWGADAEAQMRLDNIALEIGEMERYLKALKEN